MGNIVGIDIGKKFMYYCLVDEAGEVLREESVPNDQEGFDLLLDLIQECSAEVIFEATGVYSRRWQFFLELNQIPYIRMNPLRAKKEMDTLRNNKNDKIDARKLAILQLKNHYQPSQIEAEIYRELRRRDRFYQAITQQCASAKNRVQKLVEETFSNLTEVVPTDKERFYWVASCVPHVAVVHNYTDEQLFDLLADAAPQKFARRRLITKLREVSLRTSVAVSEDSFAVYELRYWANQVIELMRLKRQTIDDMLQVAEDLEEVEIVSSIPGVGRASAVCLIAELGDVRRFETPQKLNAFVGLDLRFNDSGELKTNGFISKRGNSTARKLLYRIFMSIIMIDKNKQLDITQWYWRRTRGMSGGKKKIIVGGMDRTLRLIHHLVLKNETLDVTI